jgi:flagellar hook protein FlgE
MSFQQGLSGLNATSKNLQIIGNNIANANTVGAKAARAEFADLYANALNGVGTDQVGIGVNLQTVAQQFTQGNITTTENRLDLAINGGGFFQVADDAGAVSYTRNGQFKVDREGRIVNNSGLFLLGYRADGVGAVQPGLAMPLQLPTGGVAPRPTASIDLEANLDPRGPITRPAAGAPIVYNDPATYNNATSQTLYDARGQGIAVTYYFQKAAADTWDVYATANGTTVGGTAAAPAPIGRIAFTAVTGKPTTTMFTFDIPNPGPNSSGAAPLPLTGLEMMIGRTTQYGAPFGVTDLRQDGYAPGQLTDIAVEPNGLLTASYSNGQTLAAGQIEVARFRNPQGLQAQGGNVWTLSAAAGDPMIGVPGEGSMGVIQSGALEESNVDLTGELVNMITAQRIYQANAQTIKTQDQILQTLVNLR